MSETITRGEPADNAPTMLREDRPQAQGAPPLGIIGLAGQGQAVALSLLRAGHRALACDADIARVRAYAEAAGPDADVTDSPAEVGRRCDIILLLLGLGDDAATIHGALRQALAPGSLIVDMGPSLPGEIRRLAAELEAQGVRLLDAVLLAGAPAVVLIGGNPADLELVGPILGALGTCVPTGAAGTAQALSALIAELDAPPDLAGIRRLAAG